jgi:hypothetical protein
VRHMICRRSGVTLWPLPGPCQKTLPAAFPRGVTGTIGRGGAGAGGARDAELSRKKCLPHASKCGTIKKTLPWPRNNAGFKHTSTLKMRLAFRGRLSGAAVPTSDARQRSFPATSVSTDPPPRQTRVADPSTGARAAGGVRGDVGARGVRRGRLVASSAARLNSRRSGQRSAAGACLPHASKCGTIGHTRLCVPRRGYARLCAAMRGYARLCVPMRGYARLCVAMRGYAGLCGAMRGPAVATKQRWIQAHKHLEDASCAPGQWSSAYF